MRLEDATGGWEEAVDAPVAICTHLRSTRHLQPL